MRILVTGATGFLGSAFCRVAQSRGHEILALIRDTSRPLSHGVQAVSGDITNTPWAKVKEFKPDTALHLAWIASPGIYLESPENDFWLEQSKIWLRNVKEIGINNVFCSGTCIEYAATAAPLEETAPLNPIFPYSKAKVALFEWLGAGGFFSPQEWGWLRVFYPYGPGEHPGKLTSSMIRSLRENQRVALRTPGSVKDFIFIDDVAAAMCCAIETGLTGAVNIGSGQGISIQALARRIAELLKADPSLIVEASELSLDPTPLMVAENRRLCNAGWKPETDLDMGLHRLIGSLSSPPLTSAHMVANHSNHPLASGSCPGCHSLLLGHCLHIGQQPVILNYRFSTPECAKAVARRDMQLRECNECGLVFNAILDADAIPYDEGYENRQNFSSGFMKLLEGTSERLTEQYNLAGGTILEVGCGKGDFLKMICARADARGFGYDTSCEYEGMHADGRLSFFQRYVTPADVTEKVDMIICRHVVEHVPEIGAFFCLLYNLAVAGGNSTVYVETPAFEWIVEHHAFWDIFYEHCNYFPTFSLARLAELAGFEILSHHRIFGAQYQALELRPAKEGAVHPRSQSRPAELLPMLDNSIAESVNRLKSLLVQAGAACGWAIWGAGAKGVSLAGVFSSLPPSFVIDSNPSKQGMFLPGTGIPVISPEDPQIGNIGVILVANGNYVPEIKAKLSQQGISPQLLSL